MPHVLYSANAATMLYFHGNAGNLSHRLIRIREFMENLKCNIMIVDYRGYVVIELRTLTN
jgi:hypothetical protein